jgi:hypothetical protein
LTAEGAGEIEQQRVLGNCAAGVRCDQLRQSLSKDSARTPSVAAEETTNVDVQDNASASPRQVSQGALIAAVDAARPL